MLHGVCSPFMLTTPTIGLSIAESSRPIARIKARCGVRLRPRFVISERNFGIRPPLDHALRAQRSDLRRGQAEPAAVDFGVVLPELRAGQGFDGIGAVIAQR